uniref:BED-type domain-containing protein n=1 Tax=Amphimedon queenslandica TaxID=400682 RepID=A0A1X7TPU4_AMPQE
MIACEGSHAIALNSKGQVFSWGTSPQACLGHEDAVLFMWGWGARSQLGQDEQKSLLSPTPVNGFNEQPLEDVSCSYGHTAAITANDVAYCWDDNARGKNYKAKCKHCGSMISASTKTCSNFTTHLKRKHPNAFLMPQAPAVPAQGPKADAQGGKYREGDPRQKKITDLLIYLIAKDMLSPSLVESDAFIQFVSTLDQQYQLPSQKHLMTTLLTEKCTVIDDRLKQLLGKMDRVCITLDLCSNLQMKGYLAITCHFIQDWSIQSVLLGCMSFFGCHTADNIARRCHETLDHYSLAEKISNIITDNASTVLNVFRLPGFDDCSSPALLGEFNDVEADENEIEAVNLSECMALLPQHDSCFAHTIQLVVKDGIKNARAINEVLTKAANIVSCTQKSINTSDMLEGEGQAQANIAKGWNSDIKVIRSLLSVPVENLQLLDCQQLSSYERVMLNDLIEILIPFEEATDALQEQDIVTGSFVIPCIRGLQAALDSLKLKHKSAIVTDLLASLNYRMSCYESRDHFICAAILDPRFKLVWCSSNEEKMNMKSKFIEIMSNEFDNEELSSTSSAAGDSVQQPQPKRRKLFSYLPSTKTSSRINIEVDLYLSEPALPEEAKPLDFWKLNESKFPKLSRMAKYYLSIPASSAPVERLFSIIAGKIFRQDRCSMTDAVFQKLIAIKYNGHIIN